MHEDLTMEKSRPRSQKILHGGYYGLLRDKDFHPNHWTKELNRGVRKQTMRHLVLLINRQFLFFRVYPMSRPGAQKLCNDWVTQLVLNSKSFSLTKYNCNICEALAKEEYLSGEQRCTQRWTCFAKQQPGTARQKFRAT